MVFLREAGAVARVAWRVSPVRRRRAVSDARVDGRVEDAAAVDALGRGESACGGALGRRGTRVGAARGAAGPRPRGRAGVRRDGVARDADVCGVAARARSARLCFVLGGGLARRDGAALRRRLRQRGSDVSERAYAPPRWV